MAAPNPARSEPAGARAKPTVSLKVVPGGPGRRPRGKKEKEPRRRVGGSAADWWDLRKGGALHRRQGSSERWREGPCPGAQGSALGQEVEAVDASGEERPGQRKDFFGSFSLMSMTRPLLLVRTVVFDLSASELFDRFVCRLSAALELRWGPEGSARKLWALCSRLLCLVRGVRGWWVVCLFVCLLLFLLVIAVGLCLSSLIASKTNKTGRGYSRSDELPCEV